MLVGDAAPSSAPRLAQQPVQLSDTTSAVAITNASNIARSIIRRRFTAIRHVIQSNTWSMFGTIEIIAITTNTVTVAGISVIMAGIGIVTKVAAAGAMIMAAATGING